MLTSWQQMIIKRMFGADADTVLLWLRNYGEEFKPMLDPVTSIVLANLDWLQHHLEMKLDYGAGVVLTRDGEPEFTLADLATAGLTPATESGSLAWVLYGISTTEREYTNREMTAWAREWAAKQKS
jgi:hypothetical protein